MYSNSFLRAGGNGPADVGEMTICIGVGRSGWRLSAIRRIGDVANTTLINDGKEVIFVQFFFMKLFSTTRAFVAEVSRYFFKPLLEG